MCVKNAPYNHGTNTKQWRNEEEELTMTPTRKSEQTLNKQGRRGKEDHSTSSKIVKKEERGKDYREEKEERL